MLTLGLYNFRKILHLIKNLRSRYATHPFNSSRLPSYYPMTHADQLTIDLEVKTNVTFMYVEENDKVAAGFSIF